ncbi:dihydrolipoyllysine-residue acetyltransferase [Aliidiomarina taiwanensis]|uniref:Acetyltransferase component of pyruvate dehydrogenase complex n=1 Tax=Aliidiomarina taiwanensis TaxID=946228 RepID=A0A432X7S5_9GAMM|nr:dihydrolipoyllysine-residue acetyltransferase [Aliidiomarina taiwanensis]RUO42908.1 dihydrolipoyllysine-residue acetyltransferase [Aliidiomarina taiwanensis]
MADVTEVKVPDVGGDEVEVIEVLVSAGDDIEVEDGLVTVETDKASMDIPSPIAGTVKELKVAVGDKLNQGDLLALVASAAEAEEETAEEAPAEEPEQEEKPAEEPAAEPAPAAKKSGGTDVISIEVPDLGEDGDVDVIEVLVSEGDSVEVEDGLITVETDKATMDVPSTHAGVIKSMSVSVGDKVRKGSKLVELEITLEGEAEEAPAAESAPKQAAEPAAERAAPQPTEERQPPVPDHPLDKKGPSGQAAHASPAVRRLAREFGVDLAQVKGSGPKERVLKEDVQSYVKYELSRPKASAAPMSGGAGGLQVIAQPKVDFSKFGEIEEVQLTRIQRISGPNLHRNWVTIPHVTQFDEADITELEAFRKSENAQLAKRKADVKFTPLVFIMKAVAKALQEYPVFNSSLSEDGEHLIMKKYVHIGIAVDTPNGLVVPVIRDVDKKGIVELSYELTEMSAKARDGKLKVTDMQGGCFSISSLGGIGGTAFTPIVNAPEVAILGVSKSDMKPVWNGSEFEPRLMLPLSLSYDHRVIDGAVAARFTVYLSQVLSDIRKLIL